MKKFFVGVIVGVLIFASASAFADSVGIIGKKVTGIYTVVQGGKSIAEAGIINGSAYAPVRAVSQAAGVELTVEGKKIIMSENENTSVTPKSALLLNLNSQRDQIVREIAKREAGIQNIQSDVIPTHEQLAKELANNGTLGQQQLQLVESLKQQIEQMKAELVTYNKQLVDIDAKIAELLK
ncbi:hypothetical protein [Paenibacillus tianjinensis]|uniref:Uncharacterized protein n=1 Tax=Paenibacillus tianjinensis TaxID=2810347 RepID=A0ABX7L7J2_9BACL|nr:hypothetical protein [Paenibacillus tianjinensis]QSF42643.1 hypothetical protein JRJ22_15100 [Paenibacillus tianjinensis]